MDNLLLRRREMMAGEIEPPPPLTNLTFTIVTSGTITWRWGSTSSGVNRTIQYSKNGGAWTNLTSSKTGVSVSVSAGDVLEFKGDKQAYSTSGSTRYNRFGGTADFYASGSLMSLYGDKDGLVIEDNYAFWGLFYGNTHILSAPSLPAKTLSPNCYGSLFRGCTGLTSAPALPSTTLAQGCYSSMFNGCTSLTIAPMLPATTMVQGCYSSMFNGCTSLTAAPVLPALTAIDYCYQYMFMNCSSLTYIKAMFTSIVNYGTSGWVDGVAANGTFVKNIDAIWTDTGVNGVPSGWTVQYASS